MNIKSNDLNMNNEPDIIELRNIKKYFPVSKGILSRLRGDSGSSFVRAVDDISFSLKSGDIHALAGESGCGKTTTARVIGGLNFETSGEFFWKGKKFKPNEREKISFRKKIQFIFQNPYASLHPRLKIGKQLSHALVIQNRDKIKPFKFNFDEKTEFDTATLNRVKINSKALRGEILTIIFFVLSVFSVILGYLKFLPLVYSQQPEFFIGGLIFILGLTVYFTQTYNPLSKFRDREVLDMLSLVGLNPAEDYYDKYPHELSGGERQRVAIARAIIVKPEVIIADEPTSMLDVSIRTSILDLMRNLKDQFNLTILFITHDLAVAKHFCSHIAIMYVGEIVEIGTIEEVFEEPRHPYTWTLLKVLPVPDPDYKTDFILPEGEVPDAINPPTGCRFHPRCQFAEELCKNQVPTFENVGSTHKVACHFQERLFNNQSLKII